MKRWLQMAALSFIAAGASASAQSLDAEKARLEAERARSDADRANKQPGRSNFYLGAMVEAEGQGAEAVKYYSASAREGNCHAAMRLAQLYERGWSSVRRDFVESLKWYDVARRSGCAIPVMQSQSPPPPAPGEQFQHAAALDAGGHGPAAVAAYERAARSGDCHAALRLGEAYDKALIGLRRDYAQSLKWYNFARVLGCEPPAVRKD